MDCLGCGYELSGLAEPRCPECGRAFDPGDPSSYGPVPRNTAQTRTWERAMLVIAGGPLYANILAHTGLLWARASLGRWPRRYGADDPGNIAGIDWVLVPALLLAVLGIPCGLVTLGLIASVVRRVPLVRGVLLAGVAIVLWSVGFALTMWDPAEVWVWALD